MPVAGIEALLHLVEPPFRDDGIRVEEEDVVARPGKFPHRPVARPREPEILAVPFVPRMRHVHDERPDVLPEPILGAGVIENDDTVPRRKMQAQGRNARREGGELVVDRNDDRHVR